MAKKETNQLKEVLERVQGTLKDAEETVVASFKDAGERLQGAQTEAKKRIEAALESFSGPELTDRLALNEALADLKAGFENRIEVSGELLWAKLGLATKADVDALSRKVAALTRKLNALETKKTGRRAEA